MSGLAVPVVYWKRTKEMKPPVNQKPYAEGELLWKKSALFLEGGTEKMSKGTS
jgi:hypothetical protein